MSLSELIKFRKLDTELSDDEFFDKFCKQVGREVIVSALAEHFKNDLEGTKNATSIQSNIMLPREQLEAEPTAII